MTATEIFSLVVSLITATYLAYEKIQGSRTAALASKGDYLESVSTAATGLIGSYQQQVQDLQLRVKELQADYERREEELIKEISNLRSQIGKMERTVERLRLQNIRLARSNLTTKELVEPER